MVSYVRVHSNFQFQNDGTSYICFNLPSADQLVQFRYLFMKFLRLACIQIDRMARRMPQPGCHQKPTKLDICPAHQRRQDPSGRGTDAPGSPGEEEKCTVHPAFCGNCSGKSKACSKSYVLKTTLLLVV